MDYGEIVAGIVLVVVLVGLTISMRREARAKDVGRPDAETQASEDDGPDYRTNGKQRTAERPLT